MLESLKAGRQGGHHRTRAWGQGGKGDFGPQEMVTPCPSARSPWANPRLIDSSSACDHPASRLVQLRADGATAYALEAVLLCSLEPACPPGLQTMTLLLPCYLLDHPDCLTARPRTNRW